MQSPVVVAVDEQDAEEEAAGQAAEDEVAEALAAGARNGAQPRADARTEDDRPRVYAKTRFVWIYPEPDANGEWIGYLATGGSAPLKGTAPKFGPGCDGPFVELVPTGFVCIDETRATLDRDDPQVTLLEPFTARTDGPWPFRYGESIGLVRYRDLPSEDLQARNESDLLRQLGEVALAREGKHIARLEGIDVSLPVLGPPTLPALARTVHEPYVNIPPRSTVAYTGEARHGDRGFLLGADFSWIPKDRVKPYPLDGFHGVELGPNAHLPIAFFRGKSRPKYHRSPHGDFVPTGRSFARLSHVPITGETLEHGGERYLVTWQPDLFVKESDAVVPAPSPPPPPSVLAPGARWFEVSIRGGWLIAMQGETPVYVTLVSPGRGGEPVPGHPTLETASTPTGTFTINTKIVTATMVSPVEVHSDVPWVQNFVGPYSLHAAYWHDDWGELMSGGCVNLSPIDARWAFEFSEPKLPAGWHAVRRDAGEASTVVVIHP